jgi:hypothetical protein
MCRVGTFTNQMIFCGNFHLHCLDHVRRAARKFSGTFANYMAAGSIGEGGVESCEAGSIGDGTASGIVTFFVFLTMAFTGSGAAAGSMGEGGIGSRTAGSIGDGGGVSPPQAQAWHLEPPERNLRQNQ